MLNYYKEKNDTKNIENYAFKLLLYSPSVNVYCDLKSICPSQDRLLTKLDKTNPETIHIFLLEKLIFYYFSLNF